MQGQELELDLQLVRRVKTGERAAFDSLVDKYKEKTFALAFNMLGNYEDAKDILQEAFVRAYVNIKNFREDSSFYTWFYKILVNLCRDFLRRKSAQRKVFVEPLKTQDDEEAKMIEAADRSPNPSEAALDKEIQAMAEEAINLLSEKQRTVFILRHIQGMKIDEIAKVLNCNESTVKVHLFRAVRNLQKSLLPYLSIRGGI
ncbi:MAG: hypothetical protein AMJ78_02230 [Omnitrophica WOR_2 bacterium SM23_29]|nr:MAG: hypothetical protein AMJ78_02230 [Omnitrophica WOR_2 bacterium SM23_29]